MDQREYRNQPGSSSFGSPVYQNQRMLLPRQQVYDGIIAPYEMAPNPTFRQQDAGQLPFYMTYPEYGYENEADMERDVEYMKGMFPKKAKVIQKNVEDMCDKLEYEGSMLYDEYPDRVMLRKYSSDIYDKVKYLEEEEEEPEEEDVFAMSRSCTNCRNPFLQDLIDVLFFNEINRRRCRHRGCRRYY